MKKNKTNKIVVNVTQKHINEGISNINTSGKCIIALALKDKFPNSIVDVFYESVEIGNGLFSYSKSMKENQLSVISDNRNNPSLIKKTLKPFKFYLTKE